MPPFKRRSVRFVWAGCLLGAGVLGDVGLWTRTPVAAQAAAAEEEDPVYLLATKQYTAAEAIYRRRAAADPDDLDALEGIVRTYQRRGLWDDAAREQKAVDVAKRRIAANGGRRPAPRPAAPVPAAQPAAVALAPAAKGDIQLDGIYLPVTRILMGISDDNFRFFRSDGYAYLGLPRAGLDHFDFGAAAAATPEKVATYLVRGNQIIFTPLRGAPRTEAFMRNAAGDVLIGDDSYSPGEALGHNQILEGTFGGRVDMGGARQKWSFTFTRDGRFSADSILALRTSNRNIRRDGLGQTEMGGFVESGTYTCDGTTLTTKADNGGTAAVCTIFVCDPRGKSPIYVINGKVCFSKGK